MEPEETPEVSAQPEAGMSQVAGLPGSEPVSEAAAKAVGPDTSEFEEEMPEDFEVEGLKDQDDEED